MGYGDTDQRQEEGSTGTKARGTTTTTTTTTTSGHGGNGGNGVTGQNGNGGNGETGITVEEVGLEALAGEWIYLYVPPFNEYIGPYHLMSDGTAMIGEGVLGEEHEINTDNVITYVGSDNGETESFEPQLFRFQNLNPRYGDLVVIINNDIVNTVPAEGLELMVLPNTLVRVIAENTPVVGRSWGGDFITLGLTDIEDQSEVVFVTETQYESDTISINIDYQLIDTEQLEVTRTEVRERVADIFYKKFFENEALTDEQVLSMQTTIRDGKAATGRTEDEILVFYKKDRNTLESKKDLQGQSFSNIVEYVYARGLLVSEEPLENNFTSVQIGEPYGDPTGADPNIKLKDYTITFIPDNESIVIATEKVRHIDEMGWVSSDPPQFINTLNLSQILKSKIGRRVDSIKAREVLDTNIFELLPTQSTRQNEIDKFFNDFNRLVGPPPSMIDADNDGVGEQLDNPTSDRVSRISMGDNPNAFITRLDSHTVDPNGEQNEGKTLESLRNRLNVYLGDVDNVVQVIEDQRPEYTNKSRGFLKIRKPNQAIILRNQNDGLLEFQKNNSFLTDGFTITMWVRFVGKTGGGTLFNFGNPLSSESPYGFRLETLTRLDNQNNYRRIVRLIVRDHIEEKLYDSSFGTPQRERYNTIENNAPALNSSTHNRFYDYIQVPTSNLNEWFFICATYNPSIMEEFTFEQASQFEFEVLNDKQVWLNHRAMSGALAASTQYGARCKVEIISRSDLLRARGYKVDDLTFDVIEEVEEEQQEQQEQGTFAG